MINYIVPELMARALRLEKEIKVLKIGKEEIEPSLFTDTKIECIWNPKEFTDYLLDYPDNLARLPDCISL